ncbi:MAG: Asp23/Gls24 family envelope stress response protein [Chlamydiales bacterium]|nr:Asp23/Gls24 family envelope stress response protein [Chlamydiales bacterium]
MYDKLKNLDAREIELPETVFIRDIETRVFQTIALQCLAKIEGIGLLEGNLFDSLLGRDLERVKGIYVEQDQKKHSVDIRVEINIQYGISIPEKAEEVQTKLVEEISRLSGLHVATVHVIVKNMILPPQDPPLKEGAAEKDELEEVF